MAAKDLQIARRDGHISGPRDMRLLDQPSASGERNDAGNPIGLLLGALRRQWILLLLAVIASGVVAYLYATNFSSASVTAHLRLSSRRLPLSSSNIYSTPTPNAAAKVILSPAVLKDVADAQNLPSAKFLAKCLELKPDTRGGAIAAELTLSDDQDVVSVLNDIGEAAVITIREERTKTLDSHELFISSLLNTAVTELDQARDELGQQLKDEQSRVGNINETTDRIADERQRQIARAQQLVDRLFDLGVSQESAEYKLNRLSENTAEVREGITLVLHKSIRELFEARVRQVDNFAEGFTRTSRQHELRISMQAQLAAIAESLPNDPALDESADTTITTEQADEAEPVLEADATTVVAPDEGEERTEGLSSDENSVAASTGSALDVLSAWTRQLFEIGDDSIGGFDPETLNLIQATQNRLQSLEATENQLQIDQRNLTTEIEYYQSKITQTQADIDALPAVNQTAQRTGVEFSKEVLAAQQLVAQKEALHSRLANELMQIDQVKGCPITEYFVSSPAESEAGDVKSDRRKLFVFSLFGSLLLFASPAVLLEWLRMRPTPASVFSRRWNLPVLGIQPANRVNSMPPEKNGMATQDTLRLMALRIQQSLFQPSGRVVLFSGLDHCESPMGLIRELARCLAQREESVLIIQSLPCQLQLARKSQSDEELGRPGMAEFLAGTFDEASELVIGTGIAGVDFLPGGRTRSVSEAMASRRVTELVDQFRDRYSMIFMAGPSTLNPADLQMLAARADGIVFTVTRQSLREVYGKEVLGDLIELGAPILGFAEQPTRGKHAVPAVESSENQFAAEFHAAV